jgi:Xaa-Pro aminopeptidase
VPQRARRIAWLSGFTGSAGLIAVLAAEAAVFTDGRYTLQVQDQVDGTLFENHHITDAPVTDWLADRVQDGDRIGYDPWLFTEAAIKRYQKALAETGAILVAVDENILDQVWTEQPPAPLALIQPYDLAFAGETSEAKRTALAAELKSEGRDAAVITATDSIAWLLNIRGGDVGRSPLPLSYAVLHASGHCDLFVDKRKITGELERHLGNQVVVHGQDQFLNKLEAIANNANSIQIDKTTAAASIVQKLSEGKAEIVDASDPCKLPKACKNDVELAGIRTSHLRDGVAESRFLHWLATAAQDGSKDEIEVAEKLENFRREGEHFRDLSCDTISGSGPNGAIVHYRVTADTNRKLGKGELYLVDSGAQYLDGTTDITRTVAIGIPSDEMRDRFTRVLKGHIAIARAVFPAGTSGGALDILARQELWRAGLDYDHGTGHGVGCYLGVHEGPQSISKVFNNQPLLPGMIISNEPGYYKTGEYGIRIENLVAVREARDIEGGERQMLSLETLTFAPIDRNLVDAKLLTAAELDWLNDYHQQVWDKLAGDLPADSRAWLKAATLPI